MIISKYTTFVLSFAIAVLSGGVVVNSSAMGNNSKMNGTSIIILEEEECYICDGDGLCDDATSNQSGGNSCSTSQGRCSLWGGACSGEDDEDEA